MYQRRTHKKTDDAVSPVVGVMLMLVVTIVVAAVVALFASGVVTDVKTAPTVSANVTLSQTGSVADVTINSTSEILAKNDLLLKVSGIVDGTYYTNDGALPLGYSGNVTTGVKNTLDVYFLSDGATATSIDETSKVYIKDFNVNPGENKTIVDETATITETEFATYFKKVAIPSTDDNNVTTYVLYTVGTTKKDDSTVSTLTIERSNLTVADAELSNMIKAQADSGDDGDMSNSKLNKALFTCNPGYTFEKNDCEVLKYSEDDIKYINAGEKYDIEIIYTPSNAVIYSKSVVAGA